MKKVSKIVIIIISILTGIAVVISLLIYWFYHSPIIGVDVGLFFECEDEYNMIAKACYNNYLKAHQDNEEITRLVYNGNRGNSDYLFCYDHKYHLYLSKEECDAIDKIDSTFHIKDKPLNTINIIYDNFVVFDSIIGIGALVYSANDEKPTFISSDMYDDENIYVKKLTEHWYFTAECVNTVRTYKYDLIYGDSVSRVNSDN